MPRSRKSRKSRPIARAPILDQKDSPFFLLPEDVHTAICHQLDVPSIIRWMRTCHVFYREFKSNPNVFYHVVWPSKLMGAIFADPIDSKSKLQLFRKIKKLEIIRDFVNKPPKRELRNASRSRHGMLSPNVNPMRIFGANAMVPSPPNPNHYSNERSPAQQSPPAPNPHYFDVSDTHSGGIVNSVIQLDRLLRQLHSLTYVKIEAHFPQTEHCLPFQFDLKTFVLNNDARKSIGPLLSKAPETLQTLQMSQFFLTDASVTQLCRFIQLQSLLLTFKVFTLKPMPPNKLKLSEVTKIKSLENVKFVTRFRFGVSNAILAHNILYNNRLNLRNIEVCYTQIPTNFSEAKMSAVAYFVETANLLPLHFNFELLQNLSIRLSEVDSPLNPTENPILRAFTALITTLISHLLSSIWSPKNPKLQTLNRLSLTLPTLLSLIDTDKTPRDISSQTETQKICGDHLNSDSDMSPLANQWYTDSLFIAKHLNWSFYFVNSFLFRKFSFFTAALVRICQLYITKNRSLIIANCNRTLSITSNDIGFGVGDDFGDNGSGDDDIKDNNYGSIDVTDSVSTEDEPIIDNINAISMINRRIICETLKIQYDFEHVPLLCKALFEQTFDDSNVDSVIESMLKHPSLLVIDRIDTYGFLWACIALKYTLRLKSVEFAFGVLHESQKVSEMNQFSTVFTVQLQRFKAVMRQIGYSVCIDECRNCLTLYY